MSEIKTYCNKELLNRLSDMQRSSYYAPACHTLMRAEQAIVNLENEIEELRAALAQQGVPVAWVSAPGLSELKKDYPEWAPAWNTPTGLEPVALYTHPQPLQQGEPVAWLQTFDGISRLFLAKDHPDMEKCQWIDGVTVAPLYLPPAHHGIKGEK